MKRLVEDAPLSSSEQKLSELLRQIEPATSDPFRKRRIWASLMTTRTRPARRAPWPLRGLAIVALLGGGTAAAALGGKVWGGAGPLGGWFGAAPEETTDSAPRETRTSNPPAPPGPAATDEARLDAGGPPPAPSEIEPLPPTTDSAEATQTAPPHAANQELPRTKRPAEGKPSGEDPAPVLAAIRAWRSEGDAARAQRLLDAYLRDNPRGALAEDALALSIEVAAARKDPRAVSRAKRYLAAYPKGRFRGLAEQVVQGAP